MSDTYNPIVRTFCQLRAAVLEVIDVDRRIVRPDTPLEELMPPVARRQIWTHLRRQGLNAPSLELSARDARREFWGVLLTTLKLALAFQRWPVILVAFPLAAIARWASRHRAVHFPLGLKTVGELVIYLTSFRDHRTSGYRWTRNEIALKVRLIIAQSAGLSLDEVQPERTLADLGFE